VIWRYEQVHGRGQFHGLGQLQRDKACGFDQAGRLNPAISAQ
jgi:hypothetical protein